MPYIKQEDRDRLDPLIPGFTACIHGGSVLDIDKDGYYLRTLLRTLVTGFAELKLASGPGEYADAAAQVVAKYKVSLVEALHTVGDLNYAVTRITLQFVLAQKLSYATLAIAVGTLQYVLGIAQEKVKEYSFTLQDQWTPVIGTLRLVISEIEQRLVRPYEDIKIAENGDVPEYEALARVEIGKAMAKAHVLPPLPPWDINAPLKG